MVNSAFARRTLCQTRRSVPRGGMTLVEVTVTLAILAILVVIVAQSIAWSLRERARAAAHQAALELATNMLEVARAQPWEQLDNTWAAAQTVPSEMKLLLPEGKIHMTIEPGQPEPGTRRVTAEVTWQFEAHLPPHSVELTTIMSGRVGKKAGGKP
jgi:prepilin-type N-terminal cleavage/methylation domain-containing protein